MDEVEGSTSQFTEKKSLIALINTQRVARRWLAVRRRRMLEGIARVEESVILEQEHQAYEENVRALAVALIQRVSRGACERWRLSGWSVSMVQGQYNPSRVPVSNWMTHVEAERTVATQHNEEMVSTTSQALTPWSKKALSPARDGWVQTEGAAKPRRLGTIAPGKSKQSNHVTSSALVGLTTSREQDIEWGTSGQLRPQALRRNKPSAAVIANSKEANVKSLYSTGQHKLWQLSLEELDSLYAGALKAQERTQHEEEHRRLRGMGLTSHTPVVHKKKKRTDPKSPGLGSSYTSSRASTPAMEITDGSTTVRLPIVFKAPSTRQLVDAESMKRDSLEAAEERQWASMLFAFKRRKR